jgi:hypothetical protein
MEDFKMQVYTKIIKADNGEIVGYFNNVLDASEFAKKQKYACLIKVDIVEEKDIKLLDDFIDDLLNEIY